ncbi:MAG: RNA polymerase sigma factor [Chitinophagales bacterium]|nr:RNA polymerase sigma factor [Bacteroidota bacterium]MCB9043914.1 RNA polymerase sigma factor [Chitinophagales bacterium]
MYLSFKLETELDILQGCRANDRTSQRLLYEQYAEKMLQVCLRYADSYDEANDMLLEGFMKVFLNIGKFQPHHSLESWIRRIMINNAIDHYRKHNKHKKHIDIELVHDLPNGDDVLQHIHSKEILALVQELPNAYRTVFNLYVIEGYSHREIGKMLGISEGTSKSNLSKARLKLQAAIKKIGG